MDTSESKNDVVFCAARNSGRRIGKTRALLYAAAQMHAHNRPTGADFIDGHMTDSPGDVYGTLVKKFAESPQTVKLMKECTKQPNYTQLTDKYGRHKKAQR